MIGYFLGMGAAALVLMFVFMIVIPMLLLAFWIWMIIDCATRKFKNDTDRVVWILVIIFTSVIGALIYYFVVKRK